VVEVDERAGFPKLLLKLVAGDNLAGHSNQSCQDLQGLPVKPQANTVLA